MDKWVKCIVSSAKVRGVALNATQVVQDMVNRHGLEGSSAQQLGEAVVGALLLASTSFKEGDARVNLNVKGTGVLKQVLVDAYSEGAVRSCLTRNTDQSPFSDNRGPWGDGLLSVLRSREKSGEQPYIGTVPLVTGHLAKDLTYYCLQSEQIPSAVGVVVNVVQNRVQRALGFMIQALPMADEEKIVELEEKISKMGNELLSPVKTEENAYTDPLTLLSRVFENSSFMVVEEKPIFFRCGCSKEKVEGALLLVGRDELKSILKEEGSTTVSCDFCREEYKIDQASLERLILSAESSPA